MSESLSTKKIIFFGTASFAVDILKGLSEKKIPLAWIISQPDRPAGRKKIPKASPVTLWAKKENLPLQQFEKLDEKALDFLKKEQPDLFLVAAYGKILPKEILAIPSFGAINVHGSLLPLHRGASPVQEVLLTGQKETGISLILMNEKMDAGPLLVQKKILIEKKDDYLSLEKKLAQLSAEILPETLVQWLDKKITPQQQNEKLATFCPLIKKVDGEIDWGKPAEEIFNRFRAFSVWPGVYSFWTKKENSRLKISLFPKNFQPDNPSSQTLPEGKVFLTEQGELAVKANPGFLEIESLQLEGKKKMKAREFLLGQKTFLSAILEK